MIIDANLRLSNAVAVTTSAASDIIDTLAAGDAIAPGAVFKVLVNTAVTSSGAASVTFDLQTCAESTFTTPTTLISSGAIVKASLTAQTVAVESVIPPGCLQYLRAYYTVTATLGGGNVTSVIVPAGDFDKTLDKKL